MDFHSLARRDLQALCKLNAIPANITNVAMADALTSLDIVEGIEEFMNRSPERKAVTAAKVPRTGRRTATQSKPIGNGSESVQPMARSTRRTTRRTISDEIMDESKTPAIRSSRKTVELAKTENEGIEDAEMKGVTDTRRNQVAKSSVKEVSTVQRAYSTRRSTRLTENNAVEEKEENIDSLVTELSKVDPEDGSDNKSLSGNDAEVVLQESVVKLDVVALETVNNLKDNEALDEVMIENEKEGDLQEEKVDKLGEISEQLDEPQFAADNLVIEDGDNKVLEYPMDTEDSHDQTKSDEAAPESGTEMKEDAAQEIVVDELKEKSEQCFNTLDESHFVNEVNANNVMTEDEESKVEKSLMDSEISHEQLDLKAGKEYETNKNLDSVVLATAELSAGGDSYLVESKDEILNDYPEENADQTEDEMDSENSFSDQVEPSVQGLNYVSDDKENMNHNEIKFEPTKEEAKKINLNDKSLRELTKMLKEKLQITNNAAEETGKVTKERTALQKIEDNCPRLI